jgi:hypothetical protein
MQSDDVSGCLPTVRFSNRARGSFVLCLVALIATACFPSAPVSPSPARMIDIELDTATTLPLHYGETPVAYDRVRRIRGRIRSSAADTLTLAVYELFLDDGPSAGARRLVVASRTGAPTARVIVPVGSPQQSRPRHGNIGASIAELALVLRLGILLSGGAAGGF